ncbi:hypothetical protein HYT17_01585 [Candidatus Microgenomates bacterium]|nr:hypothetical protein [Candidatus Microgenomates bacterium]
MLYKLITIILLTAVGFLILINYLAANFDTSSFPPVYKTNLVKLQVLTKEDPLFYDENSDVLLFAESAQALKEIDQKIVSSDNTYRQSQAGKYQNVFPQGWTIWPDDFLLALSSIYKATALFLEQPTGQNAQRLFYWYDKATTEYKRSIALNIDALEKILAISPERQQTKIVFLASATTPQTVLHDFLLIRKNAEELEKEISERKSCLDKGECPRKSVQTNNNRESVVKIAFNPLGDEILGINRTSQKISGPYWADTNCFGSPPEGDKYSYPFYMIEKASKKEDKIIPSVIFTNTKYYRDYRRIANQPVAQLLLKHGISLRPHSVLNDYFCTDLSYLPQLYSQYLGKGQNKLNTMPYLIERTLTYSNSLLYNLSYSQKPYDPLYLLINRSAYSLYFGTFSQSIWRLSETPIFLIDGDFSKFAAKEGYIQYENLMALGMTKEQIKKLNSLPRLDEVYQKELGIGF